MLAAVFGEDGEMPARPMGLGNARGGELQAALLTAGEMFNECKFL